MPFRERPLDPASVSGRDFVVRTGELDRMGQAVQRATAVGGDIVQTGSGVVAPGAQDPFIWVKITAKDGSTPPQYSWTQVFPDAAGGFQTLGDAASGSPGNLPAFEQNGAVLTSFPFYVRLYLGATWCYFFYPSPPATLEVYTIVPGTGDTDVDIPGILVLAVDQSSGLKLTNPATYGGTLSAQPASATHAGVVTIYAQTFAGAKTFKNNVTVVGNVELDVPSSSYATKLQIYGDDNGGDPRWGLIASASTSAGFVVTLTMDPSNLDVILSATKDGVPQSNPTYAVDMGGGSVKGIYTTVNYTKAGGGTGTLVFSGGLLTSST
jgi:hypothetical protein